MPFNPELIKVSKSNDKYSNLTHDKDRITFALKDCFSCFGLSYNKKFKNYSIGINIKEKLFARLKAVEAKAETFLDRPLTKPLLRCLVEKGEYKTLYLKPKPDQFDDDMLDEGSVVVSGLITVTAIYKGHEHPSLLVRVDEIEIKKAPPRENPEVRALCEDDDDSCTSDFCGMNGLWNTCTSCSNSGKDYSLSQW